MNRKGRLLDRRSAVELVNREYFPTTRRAIEKWDIDGVLIAGRVHMTELAVRQYAQAMIDGAPATSPLIRKDH